SSRTTKASAARSAPADAARRQTPKGSRTRIATGVPMAPISRVRAPVPSPETDDARAARAREARGMCRWMAWHGQPVLMDELLFKTKHGLVDQSLHSEMGVETTNGDGFGVGWYGAGEGPGVYHSVQPAWGDANLRQLAAHIESPLFLPHVRATTGTPIQETNCHPFAHGRWLFVHNGYVDGFAQTRRDLML